MPLPEIATVDDKGELHLHFHRGQLRAWDSQKRFVLVLAGSQGGKTSFGSYFLWREIQQCRAGDYLAVSPSFPLMNKKMLPEFLKLFEQRLALGEYKHADRMFEFSADGVKRTCPGAKPEDEIKVFFGHADDPESLESATAKAAWLDEAGQKRFRLGSWEAINTRLALHKGRCLITTTPYSLGWMKAKLYDPWLEARKNGRTHPEIEVIQFDSTENPVFPPEEFERARRELPPWRFDMRYRGKFSRPAGMIYDVFERQRHLTPRFSVPEDWPRYWGLDFGTVNCACVKLAVDPQTKRKYAYQSYWPASKRTPEEHVAALLAGDRRPALCAGGSKSEGDWRDKFARAGLSVNPPMFTDVEAGIDSVHSLLATDQLAVFTDLEDLADEFEGYARVVDDSGEPLAEIEDKEIWHRLDALRYIAPYVQTRGAGKVDPPIVPKRNEMVEGQILSPKLDLARKKGLFGLR
jgi:hypothetical protein